MTRFARPLLAAVLTGLTGAAAAQPVAYVFQAPDGPIVVPTDALGRPIVPPGLPRPAVPVAEVMNGGGFGLTGFEYYNDQISESRLGAHKRPKEYVLAPAYVSPPR